MCSSDFNILARRVCVCGSTICCISGVPPQVSDQLLLSPPTLFSLELLSLHLRLVLVKAIWHHYPLFWLGINLHLPKGSKLTAASKKCCIRSRSFLRLDSFIFLIDEFAPLFYNEIIFRYINMLNLYYLFFIFNIRLITVLMWQWNEFSFCGHVDHLAYIL